ncbi:MAG: methyltransferase domain-containing protein [Planctomycetia bacterium]
MHRAWLEVLRCPACGQPLVLDATRAAGDEVVEAFLACGGCLEVRVVVGGSAVLPQRLEAHLREQGGIYRRMPLADPRVVRFVLARLGSGDDSVPVDELLAAYGDLRPGAPTPPPAGALALGALAARAAQQGPLARALDVGCGAGRGTFELARHAARVLGVDRSAARIRRARNLAVTAEGFRLPAAPGTRGEVSLELERLARAGVDWAVAEPACLPLAGGSMDLVVLHAADGRGPLADAAVAAEALRVLRPAGWRVRPEALPAAWAAAWAAAGRDAREVAREGGWVLEACA